MIVEELKLTLSCYLNLVKERDALVSNDLQVLIYEDRVKDEHLAYEKKGNGIERICIISHMELYLEMRSRF